jgi:hypothetical protein
MVDTVRTLSALQTIFADGQAPGSITPQDVRDFVVTVFSQLPFRAVSTTTDTPTVADKNGIIAFTNASSISLTANDLGAGISYSAHQQGSGQITVVAGGSVTLVSDKATPSFVSARRGAALTIVGSGSGVVFVLGNTA